MSKKVRQRERSTVRHNRAIQLDRSKRPSAAPPDQAIQDQLTELIKPATFTLVDAFRAMGLRHRVLTLPVMVAFVLSLIWRQIGSVTDAVRALNEAGVLWVEPLQVTQQAVSERLRIFPAELFYRVLTDILPRMRQRWQERKRPLAPVLAWAQQQFGAVYALDGSTLDVLLRKVDLLRDAQEAPLAGRMAALLDVITNLPEQIWYEEDSTAHDHSFWERVLGTLKRGTLLIFDLGFIDYALFDRLTEMGIWFLTRAKQNAAYEVITTLHSSTELRDRIVWLGAGNRRCPRPLRLVEWLHKGRWYRYVTNVVDPEQLPAQYAVALYWQRWRIEDAFKLAKRLLGLAYFWVGSINGVQLQLWATWLLYAVLVDLTDAVAEELNRPFQALSMEMVFRALPHFTHAYDRGRATDPVHYLAEKAKLMGIIKQKRKPSPGELIFALVPSGP